MEIGVIDSIVCRFVLFVLLWVSGFGKLNFGVLLFGLGNSVFWFCLFNFCGVR